MTLGAGQGKTIVFLLVAMMLNKLAPQLYPKFLILTTSKALKKQLDYILSNHSTINIDIKTYAEGDFAEFGAYSLVIVDEGDLFIRKFGVDFRKEDQLTILQGLIEIRFCPILFCSVTFNRLEDRVMERLLDCPQSNWLEYESVKEVVCGHKIDPDIFAADFKGTFE